MRRELSSRASYLFQYIIPTVMLVVVSFVFIQVRQIDATTSGSNDLTLFVGVFPVLALGLLYYLSRAKRVWLYNDKFYVKGWSEEFTVRLADVTDVKSTRFWNPEQIHVRYRSSSDKESRFFFYPPARKMHFLSTHPMTEELRILIHASANPNQPYVSKGQPIEWNRVGIGVAATVASVLLFNFAIVSSIKSSTPYIWSLERVQSSAAVVEKLGTPLQPGWLITGSMKTSGANGTTHLNYSVFGPNGSGKVVVVGTADAGNWDYSEAFVVVDDEKINVLKEASAQQP